MASIQASTPSMATAHQILVARGLSSQFFCKVDTLGNGNCFFNALADQLTDNEIRESIAPRARVPRDIPHDPQVIRQKVVAFASDNEEVLSDVAILNFFQVEENADLAGRDMFDIFRDYLRVMKENGTWATEIIVRIAAIYFGKDIRVIKENSDNLWLGGPQATEPPFVIVNMGDEHLGNEHFQSVHRTRQGQNAPTSPQNAPAAPSSPALLQVHSSFETQTRRAHHLNNHPEVSSQTSSGTSSGQQVGSERCFGCGTVVKQILKHLVWSPKCSKFYDIDKLKADSARKRRESKKLYDESHKKEISLRKAANYKACLKNHDQKSGSYNTLGLYEIEQERQKIEQERQKTVSCHKSPKPEPTPDEFRQHKMCPTCKRSFFTSDDCTRHIREVHGEKMHKCDSCNENFTRYENLMRHMLIHEDQKSPHICSLCGHEFSRKDHLVRHMQNCQEEDKRFQCPVLDDDGVQCPLKFSRRDKLKEHVKRAETNPALHGCIEHCDICQKDIVLTPRIGGGYHIFKKRNTWTCMTLENERKKRKEERKKYTKKD